MFRNFILPAIVLALIAVVVHNPAFAHDTMRQKALALAAVISPALVIRFVIATRRAQRSQRSAAARTATPYGTAAPARRGR